ncbi:MAG: hypothetical protein V1645_01550 [archaeon]
MMPSRHNRVLIFIAGIILLESDCDILSGSINRSVRNDPVEDALVKELYRFWIDKAYGTIDKGLFVDKLV